MMRDGWLHRTNNNNAKIIIGFYGIHNTTQHKSVEFRCQDGIMGCARYGVTRVLDGAHIPSSDRRLLRAV